MAVDILQQFLSRRLLDIGADDSRLERIREATSDLTEAILASPRKAVAFVFAAIDGEVSSEQSAIVAASAALEARWNTYRGAFAEAPLNLFRCMIADALSQAADKDVRIAATLTYLARSQLPFAVLSGEEAVWSELIREAEAKTEAEATREWDSSIFTPPKLQFKSPAVEIKVTKGSLDVAALTAALGAASGPHDQQSTAYPKANQQWPNNGPNWSWEFAPRAARAIAGAVDGVVLSAEANLDAALKGLADGVAAYGTALARGFSGAADGTRRRTQLLWWKEALYSPSAQKSYREVGAFFRPILMAADLFRDLPTYHTQSVEYFLRETVRSLDEPNTQPIAIASWVSTIVEDPRVAIVKEQAESFNLAGDDGDLTIAAIVQGTPLSKRIAAIELTGPDFAVWLLRELQILHATKPAG